MNNIKSKAAATALGVSIAVMMMPATPVIASAPDFTKVTAPIETLLKAILRPALGIVGALGAIFCIILGVKFAKAEEPQEREKAKSHLKNAIIGFVLIFVLLLALNVLMEPMITWVTSNTKNSGL